MSVNVGSPDSCCVCSAAAGETQAPVLDCHHAAGLQHQPARSHIMRLALLATPLSRSGGRLPDDATYSTSAVSGAAQDTCSPLTQNELRRLVREWVEELKGAELPPEKVLATVKTLVKEYVVPRYPHYADAKDDGVGRIAFVRDASQWCIEAYFEDRSDGR